VITLYDTTLRDGMQGEGMSLSVDEKVRVAHALDSLGVHLIEAGFPASNPKEEALFDLLARETFETSEIAAFGMTRRRDVRAEEDPALRLLADAIEDDLVDPETRRRAGQPRRGHAVPGPRTRARAAGALGSARRRWRAGGQRCPGGPRGPPQDRA
jgi:hypothetical protein